MSSAEEKRKARMARILSRKQKGEQALANSLITGNIKELETPEINLQNSKKNEENMINSDLPKIDQDETDGLLDGGCSNEDTKGQEDVFTRFKNLKEKEENLVFFQIILEKIYPPKIDSSIHGRLDNRYNVPCIDRVGPKRQYLYVVPLLRCLYDLILPLEKWSKIKG